MTLSKFKIALREDGTCSKVLKDGVEMDGCAGYEVKQQPFELATISIVYKTTDIEYVNENANPTP